MLIAWTLRDRLRVAVREYLEHNMLYQAFTASLLAENVVQWKAQIEAWEKDDTVLPDPYEIVEPRTSFHVLSFAHVVTLCARCKHD